MESRLLEVKMAERDKIEEEIKKGDREEDVYFDEGREHLLEDDEIDELEEGFMKGYEEGSKMSKCANCGKILEAEFVEEEFHDEVHRFCSEECATKFEKRHGRE